jgi:hypothetical protein
VRTVVGLLPPPSAALGGDVGIGTVLLRSASASGAGSSPACTGVAGAEPDPTATVGE